MADAVDGAPDRRDVGDGAGRGLVVDDAHSLDAARLVGGQFRLDRGSVGPAVVGKIKILDEAEEELPAGQEHFKQLNAELTKTWPVITERKPAPPDATEWQDKKEKLKLLER